MTVCHSILSPCMLAGGDITFKIRKAPVVCERSFRLDHVFCGPLSSDAVQAQNAGIDCTLLCHQNLGWTGEIGYRDIGHDLPSVLVLLSGTSSSKIANRV